MTSDTQKKVGEYAKRKKALKKAWRRVYARAKVMFGNSVSINDNGMNLRVDYSHPAWSASKGSGVMRKREAGSGTNSTYEFSAFHRWSGECEVLELYSKCLRDENQCRRITTADSVFAVTFVANKWKLAWIRHGEQERRAVYMLDVISSTVEWLEGYLTENINEAPNETFKAQMIRDYEQYLGDEIEKLPKILGVARSVSAGSRAPI